MKYRSLTCSSLSMLLGIAMFHFGSTNAVLAQLIPPRLPPPTLERPGSNRNQSSDDTGRDSSTGDGARGADTGTDDNKPKFDDLLANKDLSRFRGYQQEPIGDGWKIDGKNLHFDGSGGGDIITKDEYDDFELQFEYKISEGGNSGVMTRVSLGNAKPSMSGPEFQILDDVGHADGEHPLTAAGSLYGMYAAKNKKSRPAGTWNEVRVIVTGNNITHYLNNVKVVEAEIGSDDWNRRLEESKFMDWVNYAQNSRGHIAFEDHGDEVWFRNIRVKTLTEPPTTAATNSTPKASRPVAETPNRYRSPAMRERPGRRFYQRGIEVEGAKNKENDKDKKDK